MAGNESAGPIHTSLLDKDASEAAGVPVLKKPPTAKQIADDSKIVKLRNNGTSLRQFGWGDDGKALVAGPGCVIEMSVGHLKKFMGKDLDFLSSPQDGKQPELEVVKPSVPTKTMSDLIAENSVKGSNLPATPAQNQPPQLPSDAPSLTNSGAPASAEANSAAALANMVNGAK